MAVSIAFLILAMIQFFNPKLLNTSFYFSIAFVSFLFSLAELIKNIADNMEITALKRKQVIIRKIEMLEKRIKTFETYEELSDNIKIDKIELNRLKKIDTDKLIKISRSVQWLDKLLIFFEFIFCVVMTILTLLKAVPNDIQTNKIINILSLISFSLFLFTLYINTYIKDFICNIETEEDIKYERDYYYLSILDKIRNNRNCK